MLTLFHDGRQYPISNTEYYIRELASGLDEVIFSLSIHDPIYAMISEEEAIYDRGGKRYLVKDIDAGADDAKIICQIDLDAWKAEMHLDYTNGSDTVAGTINAIKPQGWAVYDRSLSNARRTITGNYTPLEICAACVKTYRVYIRWDNKQKTCTILPQAMGLPAGAFALRQLNLREIQYKGKSNDFATRLYPYGKKNDAGEPLTIQYATINGAVYPNPYVENRSYADKIISVYWIDERYTVAQNLYDDAVAKLAALAKPVRSYLCSIVDLKATNPELYGNLDFSLFTVATLIDDIKDTAINYMVLERRIYPYHPEKNEIIFDSAPLQITNTITGIVDTVEDTNSDFRQIMQQEIDLATAWLLNSDSHIYIVKDENGNWKELLFLDGTEDPETATRVMRINSSGLGFSNTGVNGEFRNAFVFDPELGGHLVADFITAGTLNADVLRAGTIRDMSGENYWNLDTGEIHISAEAVVDTSQFVTQAQFETAADHIASEVVSQVGSGIFFNCVPTQNDNGTTTIRARVFFNRADVTETFAPWFFRWYKKTEDGKEYIGYGYEITVVNDEYGYGGEVEATFLILSDRYPVNQQGKWVFTMFGSFYTMAVSRGTLQFDQGTPIIMSNGDTSGDVYPVFGYDYYE